MNRYLFFKNSAKPFPLVDLTSVLYKTINLHVIEFLFHRLKKIEDSLSLTIATIVRLLHYIDFVSNHSRSTKWWDEFRN